MEGLVENKTSLPELVYSTSYAPLPNVAIWPSIPSNQRLHLMGKRHKRDATGTYGYGEAIDNWQAFVWCTGLPGVGTQTAVWWTDGCMTENRKKFLFVSLRLVLPHDSNGFPRLYS